MSKANPTPASLPGPGLKLQDPDTVIDLFQRAALANLESSLRRGGTVHLPDHGRLIFAGDVHDHLANLRRLVSLAALHEGPDRHLVLQEIIHGPYLVNDLDLSVRTLARVAALKLAYPEQVHLLQSNHELAQLRREGILKDRTDVVEAFDAGLDYIYRDEAPGVRSALNAFVRSLPLAARCPNGILFAHSLPSPSQIETFDPTVLDRVPTEEDLSRGGSARAMVWGRNHDRTLSDRLAQAWNVKLFALGHQPAMMGYEVECYNMLVLASDHNHGKALPIDLSREYSLDDLVANLIDLAGLALD